MKKYYEGRRPIFIRRSEAGPSDNTALPHRAGLRPTLGPRREFGEDASGTHPHSLTLSRPYLRSLREWGVGNATTLAEILCKQKMKNGGR